MNFPIIEIKELKKRYTLGAITGKTLKADLESLWAKMRKKEDPNIPLHLVDRQVGLSFMALNGVSFQVNKGERVGIIGGNGAGKSTLLKILSRITAPTEGEIFLRGRVASMLEVGTGFNPEMTGRENVYLNGAILGMTKAEIDGKMQQIIEFSEVAEFIDTPVKRYSSGMYVKLAFSVASHLDSEIIIMDEVLAVGDIQFQQKCLNKMHETSIADDKTILYVSHNMATIRQLCNRCVVLNEGKLIFDGEVEEAIGIYSTIEKITTKEIDLTGRTRPKSSANLVVMEKLTLTDRESAIYEQGDKITFDILFNPKLDYEVYLQVVVKTLDGVMISLVKTPVDKNLVFEKGVSRTIRFAFNTFNLVYGRYSLSMSIINAEHHKPIADMIEKTLLFEVAAKGFKATKVKTFGLVDMPEIEVWDE